MSQSEPLAQRRARYLNRYYAWLSTRGRPATGFISQPEPRTVGSYARGRLLCGADADRA